MTDDAAATTSAPAAVPRIDSVGFRDVAEHDAFMTSNYGPVRTTPVGGRAFDASLRIRRDVDVLLGGVRGNAHVLERTESLIAGRTPEQLNVGLLLSGSGTVRQFGREVAVVAGDVFVNDPDIPYSMSFNDDFELVFLLFPRRMVGLPVERFHAICARRLEVGPEVSGFARQVFTRFERDVDAYEPRTASRLLRTVVDVVGALVDEAATVAAGADGHSPTRDVPLRERARWYIESNLGDPELSPAAVADAMFISARHLHGLFRDEPETVGEYIRRRRIEGCRRDLVDPELAGLTVSEVGARWGFDEASHFSRTFRAAVGVPPGEFRRSRGGTPSATGRTPST